jgi:flagellar hook assembly protein FlgD
MLQLMKKFISLTTALAMFASSGFVAFADDLVDLTDLDVTPSTFDPADGEAATVTFDLSESAYAYIYAVNDDGNTHDIYGTVHDYRAISAAAPEVKWFGTLDNTSNGTPLADDFYDVKVFIKRDGLIQDAAVYKDAFVGDRTPEPPVNDLDPDIENFSITPRTFDPRDGEDTQIRFEIDESADVEVTIEDDRNRTIRTFSQYDGDRYSKGDEIRITWNGRDDEGDIVDDDDYTVEVRVDNYDGDDLERKTVTVYTDTPAREDVISDLKVKPSNNWDPTEEPLKITFDLDEDVDDLLIEARKSGESDVKIISEDNNDSGSYEIFWDGRDEDDDDRLVEEGTWEIVVNADGDIEKKTIDVDYEDVKIERAFVTKREFDPQEGEFTYLVFELSADAEVDVELVEDGDVEITFIEEEVLPEGWHAVFWDGYDVRDDDSDFEFEITVRTPGSSSIADEETVDVDVREANFSRSRATIVQDYVEPVIFDDRRDAELQIHYCIDEEADVTVEIYEGSSTSGSAEAELIEDYRQGPGCHDLTWDGRDDRGRGLEDGVASYKITVDSYRGGRESETGRFAVGSSDDNRRAPRGGGYPYPGGGVGPVGPGPSLPIGIGCGGYADTVGIGDRELCEALDWVTAEGIFRGYQDGSFGVNNYINRAEALKVVFEAYRTPLLPGNGSNYGFVDVDPYAWYMPYVSTAIANGMLNANPYSREARLDERINRVEMLKLAIEAGRAFNSFQIPVYNDSPYTDIDPYNPANAWFLDYAGVAYDNLLFNDIQDPYTGAFSLGIGNRMTRAEVALLLYRMFKAGIL